MFSGYHLYSVIVFVIFFLISFFLIFKNNVNLIQYPFLVLMIYLGWIFPQVLNLISLNDLSNFILFKFSIYSILCFLFAWVGYNRGARTSNRVWFDTFVVSKNRLVFVALALSLVGHLIWFQIWSLAPSATLVNGGWSGVITIYYFLGETLTIGLVLAIVIDQFFPSKILKGIIFIDLLHFLYRAFYQARREETIFLFVILFLVLWWRYGFLPNRVIIIIILILGFFFINFVEVFREISSKSGENISFLNRINFIFDLNFEELIAAKIGDPYYGQEIREGSLIIENSSSKLEFDFGLFHWDRFVHSFVPGQIFGNEFKSSLMLNNNDYLFLNMGYRRLSEGITHTGIADSFRSFWLFGCLIFYFIGFIMGKIWISAERNVFVSRVILPLLMVKGLLAFTHTTPHFFFLFFICQKLH